MNRAQRTGKKAHVELEREAEKRRKKTVASRKNQVKKKGRAKKKRVASTDLIQYQE